MVKVSEAKSFPKDVGVNDDQPKSCYVRAQNIFTGLIATTSTSSHTSLNRGIALTCLNDGGGNGTACFGLNSCL